MSLKIPIYKKKTGQKDDADHSVVVTDGQPKELRIEDGGRKEAGHRDTLTHSNQHPSFLPFNDGIIQSALILQIKSKLSQFQEFIH